MRVISGILKGRKIDGYDILGTRPTMDRIKESVFATIQNDIKDKIVLDLFSGSGNYGIEAISNLASKVYFNDINKECIDVIKRNINSFKINDKCVLTNYDYMKALNYYKKNNIKFDLVFIDPPYKMTIIGRILDFLNKYNLLNNDALVLCELLNNDLKNEYGTIKLKKEKKYGEKTIIFYKNIL